MHTMTLTRDGFVDAFYALYKLLDLNTEIELTYTPRQSNTHIGGYVDDLVAYDKAMKNLKAGKAISLSDAKKALGYTQ